MEAIENSINKVIKEPSDLDTERYQYYIENGPDSSMITPLSENQFEIFYKLISPTMRNQPFMKEFEPTLIADVTNDYEFSMRKAILDYVLLNFEERRRLNIEWIPRPFVLKYIFIFNYNVNDLQMYKYNFVSNNRTIRAPVPWHESYAQSYDWIFINLHLVNRINSCLQDFWHSEYIKRNNLNIFK